MPFSKYKKESKHLPLDAESEQGSSELEDVLDEELENENEDKFCKPTQTIFFFGKLDLIDNWNVSYIKSFLHFSQSPVKSIFAPPPNK